MVMYANEVETKENKNYLSEIKKLTITCTFFFELESQVSAIVPISFYDCLFQFYPTLRVKLRGLPW